MSYLNHPVLVVLQNAYDKGSLRDGYQYHRWLREFQSSRTGVRLNVVTEDLTNVHYANGPMGGILKRIRSGKAFRGC
jgi:hypothetical protein